VEAPKVGAATSFPDMVPTFLHLAPTFEPLLRRHPIGGLGYLVSLAGFFGSMPKGSLLLAVESSNERVSHSGKS